MAQPDMRRKGEFNTGDREGTEQEEETEEKKK
jgi:hypothetical protein